MMSNLLRTLRLLSVVVWVGGIIFFAFVLAPVAFQLLASQHEAGTVVGGTLRVLDIMGLVCGAVLLIATAVIRNRALPKRYSLQLLLTTLMLLATAYLHVGILPAMDRDRAAAGGDIEASARTDPARIHFETLHQRSEQVEGGVLLCGLALVFLMAREPALINE